MAIGYVRVSTEKQATEGVSLEAQREKFRAYCALHNLKPVMLEADEGISGKKMSNRPGLARALDATCKYKAVLVVYSLSRLGRNTRDCINVADRLGKCGADLVSITENIDTTSPMGRFFFTIMAGLAQLERDMIASRTREALNYKRSRGERLGKVPYGWVVADDGVQQVPSPSEQIIVGMIHSLRAREKYSTRDIARSLNEAGVPTKSGKPWSFVTIAGILRRAA